MEPTDPTVHDPDPAPVLPDGVPPFFYPGDGADDPAGVGYADDSFVPPIEASPMRGDETGGFVWSDFYWPDACD